MKTFKEILFFFTIFLAFFPKIHAQVDIPGCKRQRSFNPNSINVCPRDYTLVFEDNFDGTSLDLSKWKFTGRIALCSNEQQYYTYDDGDNIEVSDGTLKMISRKVEPFWAKPVDNLPESARLFCDGVDVGPNWREFEYTSAHITSIQQFKYGKIEARIRIPKAIGVKSAFWMYSQDPYYNELDVFEFGNKKDGNGNYSAELQASILTSNIHYDFDHDQYDRNSCWWGQNITDFSSRFFIYTVEWDELNIKYYIDGVLFRTQHRYLPADNGSVTPDCEALCKVYVENKAFTKDPMNIILNVAIRAGEESPPEDTVFPKIMEVDYIRFYEKEPCSDVEEKVITIDQNTEWINTQLSANTIVVNEGVKLELSASTVEFEESGELILKEGAKLILGNHSILTSCGTSKWGGIKAYKNSILNIYGYNMIANAVTGIDLSADPTCINNPGSINPKLILEDGNMIVNCDVGIYLEGRTKSYLKGDLQKNSFLNNRVGVEAMNSYGLLIKDTHFERNKEGIRIIDSYVDVRKGNSFVGEGGSDYNTGVVIEGTFPGSTGANVGNNESDPNSFSNISNGIRANGYENPLGVLVENCRFENVPTAMGLEGSGYYVSKNNTIENSYWGVFSAKTGSNFNETKCNQFNNCNAGILFNYSNNNTQFFENQFISSNALYKNVVLYEANIAKDIGVDKSASNCFSEIGTDISTFNYYGDGVPFNYHYWDVLQYCQKPTNPGEYTSVPEQILGSYCDGGHVGVFDIIDPDNDGKKGVKIEIDTPPGCYFPGDNEDLLDSVNLWINVVVNSGGDDPRTTVDETINPGSPDVFNKEKTLDQWIRYVLAKGKTEDNFSLVEQLLVPLKKWKWQKQLFGAKIRRGDLNGANDILLNMPTNTQEEIYFKNVQLINLKRLQSYEDNPDPITRNEIDLLLEIAESKYPTSGYAKSLYRILTGIEIPTEYPEISGQSELIMKLKSEEQISDELLIYPNPAKDELCIESKKIEFANLEIYNLYGKLVYHSNKKNKRFNISISNWDSGVYIIRVRNESGQDILRNFVKN